MFEMFERTWIVRRLITRKLETNKSLVIPCRRNARMCWFASRLKVVCTLEVGSSSVKISLSLSPFAAHIYTALPLSQSCAACTQ